MDKNTTIRLIYPQWQGGNIAGLISELEPDDASRGYMLGAYMLNFLANHLSCITFVNTFSRCFAL